ncbi:hypothetical protein FQA39_LY19260 [Lamprigera yunnana]|nr:hypothetical protein FQA39_LY19260 [Lamprigera yunnana]
MVASAAIGNGRSAHRCQQHAAQRTKPRPPRIWPTKACANWMMRRDRPPAFISSPGRMKKGTASSGKLSNPPAGFAQQLRVEKIQVPHQRHTGQDQRMRNRHANDHAANQHRQENKPPLDDARPAQKAEKAAKAALPRPSRSGAWLQVAASLLWLPQAAVIAWAIAAIQQQQGFGQLLWAAGAFLLLGALRAALDAAGLAPRLCGRAPLHPAAAAADACRRWPRFAGDRHRPAAGLAASVINEQADHITPYHARYATARLRATHGGRLVIVATCVAWWSWVAALVLLVAAPLIPLFMALVGWRADSGQQKAFARAGQPQPVSARPPARPGQHSRPGRRGACGGPTGADCRATAQQHHGGAEDRFPSCRRLGSYLCPGRALSAVYVGFHLLGQLPFGSWGTPLNLAQAMFVLLLAPAFFEPLRELSAVWHDKAAGVAAEQALQALHHNWPTLAWCRWLCPINTSLDQHAGCDIQVQDLGFAYDDASAPVLQSINLTRPQGEGRLRCGAPAQSGATSP